MQLLNINSLNCRGLGDGHKRQFLSELFKITKTDICFLQETHCSSKFIGNSWERLWGGKCFWSFGSTRSKGVGIWFRDGLNYKILKESRDCEGRLLSLNVQFNEQRYILTNIYAPITAKERKAFFSSFAYYLKGKHPLILGGDFNCVVNNNLDKRGGSDVYGEFGSENLKSICSDFKLVDTFRTKFGNKKEYTWVNSLGNVHVRLDRIYVSKSITKDVSNVNHLPIPHKVSDHDMVQLVLNTNATGHKEMGPGFWKCNVNVLKDTYFQTDFIRLWEKLEKNNDQNLQWWEECKVSFKKLIIAHSYRLSSIRKEKQKEARSKLNKLLQGPGVTTDRGREEIIQAQNEMDKLFEEMIEGSKIRAKVNYLEINEKPTRFFLQREKQLASSKHINILTKSDGTNAVSNAEIKEECLSFYTKLYRREEVDDSLNPFFFDELPCLSEESALRCEGSITIDECEKAIKQMSNFKTPGLDGLPKEFYAFAFKYIGKAFVRFLNRCCCEGLLPPSQRQGLITLICKDPANADTLKNWRPISLLNTDYKILSKVLTLRLRKIIGEIIQPDQTCSIPGRTIQDNVHLIRNLVEYTNDKNMPAAIISLDQSKAFDRVSHEYLFNVLRTFGFKSHFISLVKLLYTDVESRVLVNGYISNELPVQRSVRQGCSLSPLLYVLCIEPFAHRIRMDPMIKGIPLPGTTETAKMCQYADDTNLFISDTRSVKYILTLVNLYEKVSGASLNKDKTFGMWLGRWRGCSEEPGGLKWSSDFQKFYGVYIGTTGADNKTWGKVISKFEKCVNLYSRRELSFRGKSVILQTVLCSSIWYIGSLTSMPKNVGEKLNKLAFTFLWNNKPEALKRESLLNTYANGGLNIVDIKTKIESLFVKQVLQLIKEHRAKWTFLAVYWLGIHLREYVASFASLSIPHAEQIPKYYYNALRVFRTFVHMVPDFMGRQSVTTKFIYGKLIQRKQIKPRVTRIYPTIVFAETWKWVQCAFVDPRYRDLAWRIAHQIIPTQSLLYKYNISRNIKCYLCKTQPETITHLFYECRTLRGLWSFVETTLFHLTGCQVTITLNAMFHIFQKNNNNDNNDMLILLINLLKYCIWTMRNLSKHEHKKVTTLNVKAMFISSLTLRIQADFNRLERHIFNKYWCRDSALVRVEGNSIKILLRLHPP